MHELLTNFEQDVLVKVPEFFTGKSFAQRVGSGHFKIKELIQEIKDKLLKKF